MSFTVRVHPEAEADFTAIYEYLYARSPSGAANWAQAFDQGKDRLRTRPETCGLADESDTLRQEVRQLLFHTKRGRTYRAVFVFEGAEVTILRILGSGQRPVTDEDLPAS